MKRLFSLTLLLLATFTTLTTACSKDEVLSNEQVQPTPGEGEEESGNEDSEDDVDGTNGRYLILYCSRTGNTGRMAQTIQNALNCDMTEVVPSTPYDDDYNAMLERAQSEIAAIAQGNYPPITTEIESFEEYDLVFVGYPIWYGHMATPMQSFLHNHSSLLAGKRVALFASSGSSGIGTSERDAASLLPNATFEESLLLTSNSLNNMETRITSWLEGIGASSEEPNATDSLDATSLNVNIIVGDQTVTATMEDNAAARDFLSRLPLEVTLNDYNNTTEKIFYPDPELDIEGVTKGCAPVPGDITIYEPWGNVAIFCKSWSHSNDLIKIGHIDDNGIDVLNVSGNIRVKFENQ